MTKRVLDFTFLRIHRRLSSNDFLTKTGLMECNKCTICKTETEFETVFTFSGDVQKPVANLLFFYVLSTVS